LTRLRRNATLHKEELKYVGSNVLGWISLLWVNEQKTELIEEGDKRWTKCSSETLLKGSLLPTPSNNTYGYLPMKFNLAYKMI
jgi:hypothetical protein